MGLGYLKCAKKLVQIIAKATVQTIVQVLVHSVAKTTDQP